MWQRSFVSSVIYLCSLLQSRFNYFRVLYLIDQMAEWYRASASGSVDLGFDSESGRTNDFKIGIHSFPA